MFSIYPQANLALFSVSVVSDIAVFVPKRDVKLQLTNSQKVGNENKVRETLYEQLCMFCLKWKFDQLIYSMQRTARDVIDCVCGDHFEQPGIPGKLVEWENGREMSKNSQRM